MKPTYATILTNPDGKVLNAVIEIPLKTGDEAFKFIEAFQRKCGVVPKRDPEADKRLAAVIKRQELEAKGRP